MPPEQAAGAIGQVDLRSDVFGLGAILAVILTGKAPFAGSSAEMTRIKAAQGKVDECLARLDTCGADPGFVALCRRCLSPEPAHRPADAGEVAKTVAELRAAADERARQAELDMVRAEGEQAAAGLKAAEQRKRRRVQFALVGAVLGLVVATGFGIAVASLWQRAEVAKQEADGQRLKAHQYLYFSRMSLASRCWNDAQIQRMDELLAQEREQRPGENLRGFEWHYLNRIRRGGQFALRGHTDQVNSIAWSPDGLQLASCSKDSTVQLWNAREPASAIRFLRGHSTEVADVAFSPDGKQLASASFDKTVKIWDVVSGNEIKTLTNPAIMTSVSWSPDGSKLVAGSWNSTARIWDASTWESILTYQARSLIDGVSFSPDGKLVAHSAHSGFEVWDADTGQKKFTGVGHPGGVFEATWSPDGTQLASAGEDSTIKIWDAKTGKEIRTLQGHGAAVWRVRFSSDGRRIASCSRDGIVQIWDRQGQRERIFRGHTGSVKGLAFSPDGSRLASGSFDKSVLIWDINADQDSLVLSTKQPISWIWGVAFSPDSRFVASVGTGNDPSTVWEVAGGKQRFTLRGHKEPSFCVAFSSDGRRLATGSRDRTVKIWNMETGAEERTLSGHGRAIYSVAFSPDGKYLVSATGTFWYAPPVERAIPAEIKVWRVDDWQEVASLSGHVGGVTSLAFRPDGGQLATASYDKTVCMWDMSTFQQIVSLSLTESWPSAVAFRPDGAQIATGSPDGTLQFWEPVTGRQLKQFQAHPEDVMGIAYSPDGTRLATASHDTTVKLWDLALDNEILTLKAHARPVMRVAFSPDGTRLASASQDGTVRVFDGTPVTAPAR